MIEREITHIMPISLDVPDLRRETDTDFTLRVSMPQDECVLCRAGICEQLEDRLCFEDPYCGRLILHSISTRRA